MPKHKNRHRPLIEKIALTKQHESNPFSPYRLVKCKVRGCTTRHDAYYPMCTKHRQLEKEKSR